MQAEDAAMHKGWMRRGGRYRQGGTVWRAQGARSPRGRDATGHGGRAGVPWRKVTFYGGGTFPGDRHMVLFVSLSEGRGMVAAFPGWAAGCTDCGDICQVSSGFPYAKKHGGF